LKHCAMRTLRNGGK